jgi:sulfide:quinone oxidoreductase
MTPEQTQSRPFKVVVVGGGVAALEGAMTLRALAGDRVKIKLVAPNDEFVYRPQAVREPFSYAQVERYPLAEIANDIGVELIPESLAYVEPEARLAHTPTSALHYDALLLAPGARQHPRFEHALTINDRILDEQLHGLVQDVEGGYVKHAAFVIPGRMAWPLPIYELALMTANRAHDMNVDMHVTIITPEDAPLAIFGSGASQAVSKLLAKAQIDVITSAYCEIPLAGRIRITPGHRRLDVDRVVALPELHGPGIRGVPAGTDGFIPADPDGRVRELEGVFAAGDATDFPVKHGGLSAQQADAAARTIAAMAGAEIEHEPFHPVVRGILLTGAKPLYLEAYITGGHGFASHVSDEPLWEPAGKISAERLSPLLERFREESASRR